MMVPSSVVLERIGEQFNTLHCKLDWLGGKIQQLETQMNHLQSETQIKDGKIDSLETQMNHLQSETQIKDSKIHSLLPLSKMEDEMEISKDISIS